MSNAVSKEQVRSAVNVLLAVSEAIREAGSIPSGVLYATLCSVVDLAGYERIIGILKGAKLVEERAHVLTWVGPAVAS